MVFKEEKTLVLKEKSFFFNSLFKKSFNGYLCKNFYIFAYSFVSEHSKHFI